MGDLIKFPFLRGAVRHMKLVGEDPSHKALRRRNERRLAALKAANRLYEDKNESIATGDSASPYSYQFGCPCPLAFLGGCSCSNYGAGIGTGLFDRG